MARGKWVFSYKKTTLLVCFFNIVVALYILRSLYASLYIYSGNVSRNVALYYPDQIQKMEESMQIHREFKPVELIKWVKTLEGESVGLGVLGMFLNGWRSRVAPQLRTQRTGLRVLYSGGGVHSEFHPGSLDFNYWRLALSDTESTNSRSANSVGSCKLKGVKVVLVEESGISQGNVVEGFSAQEEDHEWYLSSLKVLSERNNWKTKCKDVEQLRLLLEDDEEARTFLGANGFVDALMHY